MHMPNKTSALNLYDHQTSNMKLFTSPITTTLEDGSISINVPAITPEYIDNRIKNIEAASKLNIDEVIRVIRESNNSDEANNHLVSRFNITHQAADFILKLGLLTEIMDYVGNEAFCKSEIEKWNALRKVIS